MRLGRARTCNKALPPAETTGNLDVACARPAPAPPSRIAEAAVKIALRCLFVALLLASIPISRAAADDAPYLRDRGPGIRTSMFGNYVRPRELLVYTFYEYYKDNNLQYSPDEYGSIGTQDFEGRYRANEGIIFLGYGVNDRIALEFEAAVISATFDKDPADAT